MRRYTLTRAMSILVFASLGSLAFGAEVVRAETMQDACSGSAGVDTGSLRGRVHCDTPSLASSGGVGSSGAVGRPFRLEIAERVGEPGCSSSPDGLRIIERKVFLDGQEPARDVRGYCWEPGAPRPGSDGIATPPSAEEVASQAPIPVPVVNINPHVRGLVGIETWLWYDQAATVTLPPVTLDGWTVTADLSVVSLAWDMGNGDVVTGEAPGTEDDPSATYVYENECRPCTIAMTVTWSGSYTVTHPSAPAPVTFELGAHDVSAELIFDVPEVEAVVVG